MHDKTIDPRLATIKDCLYRVSAKAVIVQDNRILLVQEDEKWWSLPGGGIDYGETVTQALQRELTEELGIVDPEKILVHDQLLAAIFGEVVNQIPRIALLYSAEISADDVIKTDHVLDYGWYTREQVPKLYVSPTIGGAPELLRHMTR